MKHRVLTVLWLVVGAGVLVVPAARAWSAEPPRAAEAGGRTLTTEFVVEAPIDDVWRGFTTSEGLVNLWSVAKAEVDFRLGGTIRTHYDANGKIGDPNTIVHHVIAFEPKRMIAMKTEAPADSPESIKDYCKTGWVVMRFDPVGDDRTRITETQMGYGEGPLADEAYAFFQKGNAWTAERMKEKLSKGREREVQNDRAWAIVQRMPGGDWIHENKMEGGKVFRVRSVSKAGPGEHSVYFNGWLGTEEGMFFHSSGQIWRLPDGSVWFQNVDEGGGVAAGAITSPEADVVEWDWRLTNTKGELHRYHIRHTYSGADGYRGVISRIGDDGARSVMVDADYHRVAEAPAEFKKLRGDAGAGAEEAAKDGAVSQRLPAVEAIDPLLFVAAGVIEPGLVKEAVVKAPPEKVFAAWATPGGIRSFLGVPSNIDLRIGGTYEILFGKEAGAPAGQQGSEGCQVLAYVPGEMLSFSWNAPPQFPEERGRRTWVVITLTPAGEGETKVRLVHTGFGEGGRWGEVRTYFDRAWGHVLDALRESHEEK